MKASKFLINLLLVFAVLVLAACSETTDQAEAPDNAMKEKQDELEAWADERIEFAQKFCKDKEVDCQALMRKAGLDKPGKVNY